MIGTDAIKPSIDIAEIEEIRDDTSVLCRIEKEALIIGVTGKMIDSQL